MTNSIHNDDLSANNSGRTVVLIIDDDRKLCRLIKDYLEPMGYLIEAAHSGPDGLEKARNGNGDVRYGVFLLGGRASFLHLRQLPELGLLFRRSRRRTEMPEV